MKTDDELRAERDANLKKGDEYIATLHVPCEFCKLDWHKHPMHCPNYHALDAARCAVRHEYFLRSAKTINGARIHEYECNLCSIPSVFAVGDIDFPDHPWCAEGKHFFHDPCYCGCQGRDWFCRCGAKSPFVPPFVRPS